jgi:homoserine/homoserine lactone efflux protein
MVPLTDALSPVLAGLSLGVALAGAPGPVQAVLLAEAIRGGVARGLRALAGANVTFALLLVALAFGLSVAAPSGITVRVLKVVGGAFLLWLALEGFRSAGELDLASDHRRTLPPAARGALAVLLNPGAWLFLGAVAAPLFASATEAGGTRTALLAAIALVIGLAVGDGAIVVLGGVGIRRAGKRVALWIRRALAAVLAGLGLWLLVTGVIP